MITFLSGSNILTTSRLTSHPLKSDSLLSRHLCCFERRFRRCLCPSVVPALSQLLASAPCLARLDLSSNKLTDHSLSRLCEGLIRNPTLTALLLADNKLGATSATATIATDTPTTSAAAGAGAGPMLGELLSRSRALTELDLSDNPLGGQVRRSCDEECGGGR